MILDILHISDTHSFHKDLSHHLIKELGATNHCNILIHSGDCSNPRDTESSEREVRQFIDWYSKIDTADYKIYVAGNHDISVERGRVTKKDFNDAGIIYLENDSVVLDWQETSVKIYGSPLTPSFCNWAFNRDRSKLDKYWQNIPEDTDILVTHGPPKGILDTSIDPSRNMELCGDAALLNHVMYRVKPKLHCFGHIHDMSGIYNHGAFIRDNIIFSNASLVKDGRFDLGLVNIPIRHVIDFDDYD